MKDIKGIIFDVDGVIFDTERMSSKFWKKTMDRYGLEMNDEIYTEVMGRNVDGIISGLEEIYGKDTLDFRKVASEKTAEMVEELDSKPIPILPGVFEILDYLKLKGYKLAVATSTRKERAEKRLKKEDIYDYIDEFMYGDQVEHSKPNPEIFLKVAEKLNLQPSECLVLEDSPAGVEAAYRGGFRCIHVVDMKKTTEEMKKQIIASCENLHEVKKWIELNCDK